MDIKEQIFAKLAEVEALLAEAECDGVQFAELDCYSDVEGALSTLTQAVDYYVD